MVADVWDSTIERVTVITPDTTEEIEERFRKVFKREMTPEERRAFFLPDGESK